MKRFYTLVSTEKTGAGYNVLLDGRAVNTPLKSKLSCPTQGMADAVMQEWAAQEELILPDTMPLTQLISTKMDRITHERAAMSALILKYLDTDLICYRTDQPADLLQAQEGAWNVWLTWFVNKFGISLEVTNAIAALSQPEAAHLAVKKYVEALDDDHFTILQMITGVSGSLILALAFIDKAASGEEVFTAVNIEEQYYAKLYKADQYGADPMQEKRDVLTRKDLEAAALYLSLL